MIGTRPITRLGRPGADNLPVVMPRAVRAQGGRALILALTAGYVDAYAYLTYQSYASFMSGNTTQTGLKFGAARLAAAGRDFLPIPAFVVGVFAGTLLLHSRLHRPTRWLFAIVAALIAACMIGTFAGALPGWVAVALLGVAMGAMNTTVTCVGAQAVSLGYVTGSLNNLAQHLALAARRLPVPQAGGAWDTHGRRAALLVSVWVAFFGGALLGGAATPHLVMWTLLPPALILVALAVAGRAPDDARARVQ